MGRAVTRIRSGISLLFQSLLVFINSTSRSRRSSLLCLQFSATLPRPPQISCQTVFCSVCRSSVGFGDYLRCWRALPPPPKALARIPPRGLCPEFSLSVFSSTSLRFPDSSLDSDAIRNVPVLALKLREMRRFPSLTNFPQCFSVRILTVCDLLSSELCTLMVFPVRQKPSLLAGFLILAFLPGGNLHTMSAVTLNAHAAYPETTLCLIVGNAVVFFHRSIPLSQMSRSGVIFPSVRFCSIFRLWPQRAPYSGVHSSWFRKLR